jgi:hypothetical protein
MRGELSQEALVPLVLRHLIPSAYPPVLANRVFGRLLLGLAISYLGDGMSFVAVAWLAIELAPQSTAGLWVGGAVAAYTLPGVVGALLFGRLLRQASARRLLLADNVIRAAFLGAVPLDRHRARLGALAGAFRVRRADGAHDRMLHARRRHLRTLRSALGDAHAGKVPTTTPRRYARSP